MIFTILSLANTDMEGKKALYSLLAILFGLPLAFFLFPSLGAWFISLFVTLSEWAGFSLPSFDNTPPSILSHGFRVDMALEVSMVASIILWIEEFAIGITSEVIGAIFRDKSGEATSHSMFDEAE